MNTILPTLSVVVTNDPYPVFSSSTDDHYTQPLDDHLIDEGDDLHMYTDHRISSS